MGFPEGNIQRKNVLNCESIPVESSVCTVTNDPVMNTHSKQGNRGTCERVCWLNYDFRMLDA
ncbi:MAG: hypothetical protein LBH52_03410 [Puniceicoccales bacterium]|nr:hypothetical protein [Puniceicoccales bacterium]